VASLLFVLAIGFCILPATIVGHIMSERESNLKHMQVISGMNMFSYWTINVLFDICKMEIPMGLCVGLLYAFRLQEYYMSMYVFFAFPIGVVPFTHAFSFFFKTEWSAQLFTIVINLVGLMFMPIGIFFMEQYSKTAFLADTISFYGRVIPSFNVAKMILFCGTAK
jgi:ATP-binding cassette subfamily A (ABC1) protein 3